MRRIKRSRFMTWLVLVALTVAAGSGIMITDHAQAQSLLPSFDKVSSDLKAKGTGGGRVTVIIQPNGAWSSGLTTAVKNNSGTVKKQYTNLKARVIDLPASAVENLASRTDVQYMSLDRSFKPMGHVSLTTGADAVRSAVSGTTLDGTGIGIAILDSGIDSNHASFKGSNGNSRIVYSEDFTGEGRTDDPYGHGTHVAGAAAGNGDIAQGAYQGVAPNANIINLRVLGAQGSGSTSALLSALDWVLSNKATYNIKVVNMSLGAPAVDSYVNDPLCQAVRRLVDAGVVVAAAAGNQGKDASGDKVYGMIHSPGTEPSAITVGAANTYGTDSRADDSIATYSSRGPTRGYWTDISGLKHYDNLVKPDVVAPGNKIINAEAENNYLVAQNPSLDAGVSNATGRKMMYMSGTSMATPVVAGAAALLLQANPKLTPNLVKVILMYTAQSLAGFNTFEQGAGQINLEGAIRVARLVRTDLSSSTLVGSPLLTGSAPSAQTTIAGYSFSWARGIVLKNSFATGTDIITKYQKVYATGVLLADGVLISNGVLVSDALKMSTGVLLSDNIITSNGVTMSEGSFFCSTGVLLSDGVLLADGVLMGDGVLISDGVLVSDGVLMSDMTLQAQSALLSGDKTTSMAVKLDTTTTTSTGSTTPKKGK